MRAYVAAAVLLPLLACQARARVSRALPPLESEGEVYLYLQPFPVEAEKLSFSIQSIAAVRPDGTAVPLELFLSDLSPEAAPRQRLLAHGRLPPDTYDALAIQVSRATLVTADGKADLHVSKEPDQVPVALHVVQRRATVLTLSLRLDHAVSPSYGFHPAFDATTPPAPVVELAGYVTSPGSAALAVFDKRRREVVAVLPAGREPQGVALDPQQRRSYVALAGDDQVQILDLAAGEETGRISLRPGDRPRELALTPDAHTLVSTNPGSRTASFLDPGSMLERDRVPVGEAPEALLLDRTGQRAYVFNRRSASVTVLDVANRQVVGTIATDPEPLRGQLNRAGTRLYVAHAGSAYLNVYALPDLALSTRFYVGLGTSAIKVDPRTDLLYVGRRDEGRLDVYDPSAFIPVDHVDLPGAPTYLVIDDAESTLLAVIPEARQVAVVDLTRRRVVGRIDVLRDPDELALFGERH